MPLNLTVFKFEFKSTFDLYEVVNGAENKQIAAQLVQANNALHCSESTFFFISALFFLKTMDPFKEPVLSMQLDKQSRGQERPQHFSAIFESTQKQLNFGVWASFCLRNIAL